MGGNIPGGNFLGRSFPGVSCPGGSLMGGNFPGWNFPGGNFPKTLKTFYYELKLFSNFDMAAKRTLNVHEGLEYLEDLEVLSSDESDFKDEFVSEGRLVIIPSSYVEGRETDKDSGEEIQKKPKSFEQKPTAFKYAC